jgi:hypothetical protein
LKIIIRVTQCVADDVLEDDDRRSNPAGEHVFEIPDGLPVPKLAAIALDNFFMTTPIACPDHFEIEAEDEDGDVLEPDSDHEALSGDPREGFEDTIDALMSPEALGVGKRAFPRYPVVWSVDIQSKAMETRSIAQDVSLGGISLLTDRALNGENVHLRVRCGEELIEAEAHPVYAVPAGEAGRFKVGLKFISFTGDSFDTLRSVIADATHS